MNRLAAILALGLALGASRAGAEPYPPLADLHVNDFADLIDAETEQSTRAALATLLRETGVEMTVVTVRALADYDPAPSLEAFAARLFDGWGVGDAVHNDGILLLVVQADRAARLQLGAAYDQGYDVIAQDIVSTDMVPAFRDGRFSEGIETATIEAIDRIALAVAAEAPHAPAADPGLFGRFDGWLFGAIFAAIAAYGLFGRRAGDALVRLRRCPGCGRRGLHRRHEVLPSGHGGPGQRRSTVACSNCDYRDERERGGARRPGPGGRGGRDRLGGGRTSGGGASGRW